MLVLSNEDVEKILAMDECMAILEDLYNDLYHEKALFMPRIDNILPCRQEGGYYAFKHMGGGWPRHRIMALRINSDIIVHPFIEGRQRRQKLPLVNGRWVGLVELFDTETGELQAIFPDGVVQRMRVGATNGLGIKFMARKDAKQAGIIGSGWQAKSQVAAMLAVRSIEKIKVFSLRKESRDAFTREISETYGVDVQAVHTAGECVQNVDIILAATSSVVPVIKSEWLSDGMHVSCIKSQEVDETVFRRCDRIVVHSSNQIKQTDRILPKTKNIPEKHLKGWWSRENFKLVNFPDLKSVIAGKTQGRINEKEITCFVNNIGIGLQFAAVGSLILKKAKTCGLGINLPSDWFSESVHP